MSNEQFIIKSGINIINLSYGIEILNPIILILFNESIFYSTGDNCGTGSVNLHTIPWALSEEILYRNFLFDFYFHKCHKRDYRLSNKRLILLLI